jgi:cell division protein FtsW (lipid II flippase)
MLDSTQNNLLRWATLFLFLYCLILTLSPAVRERSWDVEFRWSHWLGFIVWLAVSFMANRLAAYKLPDRDPYLLPTAALLSGWGLLTVWRLDETFGFRQTLWLGVSGGAFMLGLWFLNDLNYLRRYKYLLLGGGLLLTTFTLIFGINPGSQGPRLWLGCCGVYFQPSEPLKLLLVLYLAAYLADHQLTHQNIFPLLLPTVFMLGIALMLLFFQRDLGTASIFILLYAVILYMATNRGRVLISSGFGLLMALLLGYILIDVIHTRVDSWLNPWIDPSGRSYQIVQSLLAIANGGIIGRGAGLGNPGLVPIAISDFIYSAIAEETGLIGSIGLICLYLIIVSRGLIAALHATDSYRRLLASGVTAYFGVQTLLIIGGNLRFLPLTGVTLPFVSYGGSSLLTAYAALFLLLLVGAKKEIEPAHLPNPKPYLLLAGLLGIGLIAAVITTGWWAVIQGPELLNRTDNPRRAIADRFVRRGSLLDRNNKPINITEGESGDYRRDYLYPSLAPLTGYTHSIFGQAGLEASLDDYLRGLQGNPASLIWWDHLLYGTPPPGVDVRLSIDLDLQNQADLLLGSHSGAIVLMNAQTGEILVSASHPFYDPNKLDMEGTELNQNPNSPLLNRVTQGLYLPGSALIPFIHAGIGKTSPSEAQLVALYGLAGFYRAPELRAPVAAASRLGTLENFRISPMQMILASAALSNHGVIPPPRIALAVNTIQEGWVVLPALSQSTELFQPKVADVTALFYSTKRVSYWQHIGQANQNGEVITWLLSGTLPDWQGIPLVIVVTLEENNEFLAEHIASELMARAINE